MKGLILKDLIFIKNNTKAQLLSIASVFVIAYVFSDLSMITMIPIILIIFCISTFSYDEYNGCNTYITALPVSRKKIVLSKYIFTLIIAIIALALSSLIVGIIAIVENNFNALEMLAQMFGSTVGVCFAIAIMYPLIYKYGSQKGRLLLLVIFAIVAVSGFLTSELFIKLSFDTSSLIYFINKNFEIVGLVLFLASMSISYFISARIYEKKDF